jgi:ribosome biogenesis protein Nip4
MSEIERKDERSESLMLGRTLGDQTRFAKFRISIITFRSLRILAAAHIDLTLVENFKQALRIWTVILMSEIERKDERSDSLMLGRTISNQTRFAKFRISQYSLSGI